MKLLNCTATNFASYEHLSFDFSETGLALLHGATGAGKSTILDLATWGLFGITAKGGTVDEVRSWSSEEPTEVLIDVEMQDNSIIAIRRTRGTAKQNDLYWLECPDLETPHRGKDIQETQRLIEARLGISADLFLTAAYFSEFTKTGQFFTSNAKARRQVLEEVADLSLPHKLSLKASAARKAVNKGVDIAQSNKDRLQGSIDQLRRSIEGSEASYEDWQVQKAKKVAEYQAKSKTFEQDKFNKITYLQKRELGFNTEKDIKIDRQLAHIKDLESKLYNALQLESQVADWKETVDMLQNIATKCEECGQPLNDGIENAKWNMAKAVEALHENQRVQGRVQIEKERLSYIVDEPNPYATQLEVELMAVNQYDVFIAQEEARSNPFKAQLKQLGEELCTLDSSLTEATVSYDALYLKVNALTHLLDLCSTLRGELLKNAVHSIESETNRYLETYFDAEIKVTFTVDDADNLDVGIQKSGYECSYTQLSKGQRQLLKLSFSLAVQEAAANKAGVHFDNLFLDEPTEGMDADLKLKSYALFEELSAKHNNILVIDHDKGLQNLFANKYQVTLKGDHSEVSKDE